MCAAHEFDVVPFEIAPLGLGLQHGKRPKPTLDGGEARLRGVIRADAHLLPAGLASEMGRRAPADVAEGGWALASHILTRGKAWWAIRFPL